jgi:hypothetical protein
MKLNRIVIAMFLLCVHLLSGQTVAAKVRRKPFAETARVNASAAPRDQLTSPRPNGGVLREGIKSVRTILEGARTDLIASGLVHKIGALLGSRLG